MEQSIQHFERFSKHGAYFVPFFQSFGSGSGHCDGSFPFLLSVPFLDWSVDDPNSTALPDIYVDKRNHGGLVSHPVRSILQYLYRLEDTSDRERDQVFSQHKPWTTDRALDLKIRRFYGRYPSKLIVDELWVLVVDAQHVVTFSSNQRWKSRYPPLQVVSRIVEVSFIEARNSFLYRSDRDYTAVEHGITCLAGAIGILHRSFWSEIPLCLADRFSGYLGHLVRTFRVMILSGQCANAHSNTDFIELQMQSWSLH